MRFSACFQTFRRFDAGFGLNKEKGNCCPHQLSGIERQKAHIAMALANDPDMLVLDEPTSALDTVTRLEVLLLIRRVSASRAVIMATHDIAAAAKISDRTAVIYMGKVVETGTTQTLIKDPLHLYTRGLLRSYPNMSTTKDLQGIPGKRERVSQGCSFYPRCTQRIEKCRRNVPGLKLVKGRYTACHRGGIVNILETKDIFKRYRRTEALNGVSVKISERENLAVAGQSGSGKTTLARCIIGLESVTSGEIYFGDRRLVNRDKDF